MRDISDSVMPIETTVITEQRIDLPHNRNSGKKADVREGKREWKRDLEIRTAGKSL